MKSWRTVLLHVSVLALLAVPAFAVPTISGFITQIDGNLVNASTWNSQIGAIYTYINAHLVSTLNLLNAKGNLLSCDGSNVVAVTNGGAADNGKSLVFDNTQTPGMKWAALATVSALTTKGDLLGYSTNNVRIPGPTADGQVLTGQAASPYGMAWLSGAGGGVPSGAIVMWPQSLGSIPAGWVLCDGNNGTPNLQGLIPMGAGATSPAATGGFGLIAIGATGGSTLHNHSVSVSGTATTSVPSALTGAGPVTNGSARPDHTHTVTMTSTGTSGDTSTAPAYYGLAFIMKS